MNEIRTLYKIAIIIGMFLLGILLAQVFGWWLLYFIGIISEIAVENLD